jgi:ABC-type phosphate/phosphonate transport system substrate-binding protein
MMAPGRVLGALLLGWVVACCAPAQHTGQGTSVTFRGIISSAIFNHVNRNDAKAALKVCFDLMGRDRGFHLDSTIDIVDSVAEIRDRLRSHSTAMVTLSVFEYLELESSHLMTPVLTDVRGLNRAATYSYVLLVNPGKGVSTLGGLRGRNILIHSRGSGRSASIWLDVLLAKEKLGRVTSFFASTKTVDKPQACVLPLFFGVVDGCVVDEVNLDLAKEMNPQLGQLAIAARSRPMIECIIATPTEPQPYQAELLDGMLALPEDARGRQLLIVFKTDRLVRFQPSDLDSARELWRDYSRLTGAAAGYNQGGR